METDMLFKVNSTRHTKIGTLRRGMVIDLDCDKPKVQDVVKALSKGDAPVLEKIAEKDVAKFMEQAVPITVEDAPVADADALSMALAEKETAERDLAETADQLEAANTTIGTLTDQNDVLSTELATNAGKLDELGAQLAEALELATSETALKDAALAELDAAKSKCAELQAVIDTSTTPAKK
jgi:chromosome segregation ATPase